MRATVACFIAGLALAMSGAAAEERYESWPLLRSTFPSTSGGGITIKGYDPVITGGKCITTFMAVEPGDNPNVYSNVIEFEAVPARIARLISEQLTIPTIGIGAGVGTDGQILLCHDLLGVFTDFKPKFTKRFAKLTEVAVAGIKQYVKEVKEGSFPDDDHSYTVNEAEYEKFAAMVAKRRQI